MKTQVEIEARLTEVKEFLEQAKDFGAKDSIVVVIEKEIATLNWILDETKKEA